MVDEIYMLVASHLEEGLVRKIENGEFVDFAKLIPRDKIVAEAEETELKLVMREGKTFYVPAREFCNHWFWQMGAGFLGILKHLYQKTPNQSDQTYPIQSCYPHCIPYLCVEQCVCIQSGFQDPYKQVLGTQLSNFTPTVMVYEITRQGQF